MSRLGISRAGRRESAEAEGADFIVHVESGTIALARSPGLIERGHTFYGKIQDGALWTASIAWDGKAGALGTPLGDGAHRVFYDPAQKYTWEEWRGSNGIFLINEPPKKTQPAFSLYMGDHGIAGVIHLPEHTLVALRWVDSQTLQVATENRES